MFNERRAQQCDYFWPKTSCNQRFPALIAKCIVDVDCFIKEILKYFWFGKNVKN